MRAEFRADLEIVSGILVTMAEQVRAAMSRATSALLTADQTDAEEVLHADVDIDLGYQSVEERVYELLARQARLRPVEAPASGLRTEAIEDGEHRRRVPVPQGPYHELRAAPRSDQPGLHRQLEKPTL